MLGRVRHYSLRIPTWTGRIPEKPGEFPTLPLVRVLALLFPAQVRVRLALALVLVPAPGPLALVPGLVRVRLALVLVPALVVMVLAPVRVLTLGLLVRGLVVRLVLVPVLLQRLPVQEPMRASCLCGYMPLLSSLHQGQ
ncbi:MAG: hypothetical protein L6300_06900 [Syntrophaceae bacterium]|nr:hypothetical protein [Syntrophaceae bacterium]